MNGYSEFDNYLPGDFYRSTYGSSYSPQQLTMLRAAKNWKFNPKNKGDYFQRFMALQNNPEALVSNKLVLPNTPFGNIGAYLGE